MEITSLYQKKRRDFGRPTDHFASTQPELLEPFAADPRLRHEFVERNPNTVEIQACQEMSEHEVNTESVTYRSIGVLHQEGGWPKDIDATEKEQTACAPRAAPAVPPRRLCPRPKPRTQRDAQRVPC